MTPKNPFDVPGPPGRPEAIGTTDDSITLQWTRPIRDGGAPVIGYVLEKREAGTGNWERVAFGNIPDTRHKVTGLTPHKTYEFRVAAVNAAGQGDYSDNSVPITASKAASRPIISMGMLARDVIAFAGQPAKILVPFAASPKPEIVWSREGVIFDERDSRVQIESNDFLTVLNYTKCERGDTGKFHVKMENDLGSDSVDINFRVVDRPDPPEGPLEADDISPETCRLSWKIPKCDGGSPITNYIVEKCHVKGGQEVWEKAASFVRGTEVTVAGLQENERYRFRVFAENQYGVSEPLEMKDSIIAKYQFNVPSQPDRPIVRDMDRNWAEVEWEAPRGN